MPFQSPSRGGHLRGDGRQLGGACGIGFQSPSRGGHLRGSLVAASWRYFFFCFSPLHEGDTSVALGGRVWSGRRRLVSVPFTRGTPPWLAHAAPFAREFKSFSPLHEGDTSVARKSRDEVHGGVRVSVPFTRGTPPWLWIQKKMHTRFQRFSPLHEGDTSVATLEGHRLILHLVSFSPLHEGDTSVAMQDVGVESGKVAFQSPSRGGHLRGVAVPAFTVATPLFQSPSRGGHLRGVPFRPPSRRHQLVSVPFTRGTPPWPHISQPGRS